MVQIIKFSAPLCLTSNFLEDTTFLFIALDVKTVFCCLYSRIQAQEQVNRINLTPINYLSHRNSSHCILRDCSVRKNRHQITRHIKSHIHALVNLRTCFPTGYLEVHRTDFTHCAFAPHRTRTHANTVIITVAAVAVVQIWEQRIRAALRSEAVLPDKCDVISAGRLRDNTFVVNMKVNL